MFGGFFKAHTELRNVDKLINMHKDLMGPDRQVQGSTTFNRLMYLLTAVEMRLYFLELENKQLRKLRDAPSRDYRGPLRRANDPIPVQPPTARNVNAGAEDPGDRPAWYPSVERPAPPVPKPADANDTSGHADPPSYGGND